jgi:membrane protein
MSFVRMRLKFAWIRFWRNLGRAGAAFGRHDGLAHAGNMAFLGMLSFFPFLIFVVALSGFLGQTQFGQDAIAFLLENLPAEVTEVVTKPIAGILKNTRGEILTVSVIFALWTASAGVDAARAAVVAAYGGGIYRPKMWRARLESLAIVIVAAAFVILGMALLVFAPALLNAVETYVPLPEQAAKLWTLLRYGLGPASVLVGLYGMYFVLAPRSHFRRLTRLPGTLIALLVWLLTAAGFSEFLSYAGNLDVTYGGLAGVMITQIFFFVVSIGFILGAELNAVYTHAVADDRPSQRPPRPVDPS